jgi:hypothetical protein
LLEGERKRLSFSPPLLGFGKREISEEKSDQRQRKLKCSSMLATPPLAHLKGFVSKREIISSFSILGREESD